MKICTTHWAKLRRLNAELGMDSLVHQGDEAAREAIAEMYDGTPVTSRSYDPLLLGSQMLYEACVDLLGAEMLTTAESVNDLCPVCEIVQRSSSPSETEENWTTDLMRALQSVARERGLLPRIT